jgi:hypothetical protein
MPHRFGSVQVRRNESHFQRRIWIDPTILYPGLMPEASWWITDLYACRMHEVRDSASRRNGFGTINDLNHHQKAAHQKRSKAEDMIRWFSDKLVKLRNRKGNFRAHLSACHHYEGFGEHLRRSGESWKTYQDGHPRFETSFHCKISIRTQPSRMQENFLGIINNIDHMSSYVSCRDSWHCPEPTPPKMSPDDDDDDSHFGFCRATGWEGHERDDGGREYRLARFAEDAGTGMSSICSKQTSVKPSTIATWKAAILRTCIHHACVQRTGQCTDDVEPKPGGGNHVIGDALRTARLLCV